jgi:hypothetical protein
MVRESPRVATKGEKYLEILAFNFDGFVKSPSVPPWRDYCAV